MFQPALQNKSLFFLRLVLLLGLALTPTVLLAVPALATPATAAAPAQVNELLRIDGSEEMTAINQLLKQRYQKQFPEAEVDLKANGTESALEKLLNDEIDLAAIGRALTATEKAQGLVEIPISREKIAIVVGQSNPFKGSLTVEQLSQIFAGKITDWSEVGGVAGPIRVIDRPVGSDTRMVLQQYPRFREAAFTGENVVRLRRDDTTDLLQELGDDGIGYAIASQLVGQDKARTVKLVITQDVLPDDAFYPYSQPRGYVYKQDPGNAAQAFLGFATAKPGQSAVTAAKLAEARAVAAGENIISPVASPIAQVAPPQVDQEPIAANGWRWWLFLPLLLLGLLLRWLLQRRSQSKMEQAGVTVPPVSPQTTSPEITSPEITSAASETTGSEITAETASATRASEIAEPDAFSFDVLESGQPDRAVETPEAEIPEIEIPEVETPEADAQLEAADAATTETPDEEPLEDTPASEPSVPNTFIIDAERVAEIESPTELIGAELVEPEPMAELPAEPDAIDATDATPEAEVETTPEPDAATETLSVADELVLQSNLEPGVVLSMPELDAESDTELGGSDSDLSNLAEPDTSDLDAAIAAAATVTTPQEPAPVETPIEVTAFKQAFLDRLHHDGKTLETASLLECYLALATLMCDRLFSLSLPEAAISAGAKLVGEISAEYMPGPHLENSLINLGLRQDAEQAMRELGLDLKQLLDQEEEPGLGKAGLGRLMVCYLDSLATANLPAIGYGIRYEYGIFDQEIRDGWQVEVTDTWLRHGNPWEVERLEKAVQVKFGGYTEAYIDEQGRYRVRWLASEIITGIPYDTPIPGYRSETVNLLRLWKAEGDFCKVLYPVDIELHGKELRLKQQFFLVSCALQDAILLSLSVTESSNKLSNEPKNELSNEFVAKSADSLPDRFALQLNDTDPSLAIAELMRLLVDEHGIAWEKAWTVTQRTFAYTNHSLMPETLDDLWTVGLLSQFLPRHLEIIYEINYRLLEDIKAKYPDDLNQLNRMSLIDERGDRYVRLNYLACAGSHAVNGVSKMHTDLLTQTVLRDFYAMYPQKFSHQTNGVTPRRFLLQGNPELAKLISSKIGDGWITNLDNLKQLEAFVDDPQFCQDWRAVKQTAKQRLAAHILTQTGIAVDPNSLFDVQAMVVHEYKRQHLNLLRILTLYNRIKANPSLKITPRTFIFAGKAAPDYATAKLIIKLIHAVADLINADPEVDGRLKVLFLKDLNIKSAQPIYPAIDLAEHISLAGTEAADTGNLIAAMNGGLIIGTPDGTNLELAEVIGAENCFLFGQTLPEVLERRAQGYSPIDVYYANAELRAAIDLLTSGTLSAGDIELFRPLTNLLLYHDQYMLLADYAAYITAQAQVSSAYRDPDRWTKMSILTTARSGYFSSDRAVQGYCRMIWQITPSNWGNLVGVT